MTTLAEFMIIAGADKRPPMLEKSLYDSWKSRIELYIENWENGRMILNSLQNGLPPDVYATVNHHKVAKEIWDRVKLLMQRILPPEWGKFVTDVKLARDLHTTNYDQLYSYLEQHEAHANETRLMRERYQDPLAFVANYNQSPSQLNNYHSHYNTTQFPQQPNTMIPQVHSPQSYSPMYPPPHHSQPQISHSSVPPSQQYQSHQTSYVPPIAYNTP
ncbi:hypothetical protein Tco_0786800 [Tanacetum coccineum]